MNDIALAAKKVFCDLSTRVTGLIAVVVSASACLVLSQNCKRNAKQREPHVNFLLFTV